MLASDDIIGISGTFFLILAYIITTYKLVKNPIIIDIFNLYGSFAVGYNCIYKQTYPPLVLEVVWFAIATVSLGKNIYSLYIYKNKNKTNDLSKLITINNNGDGNYQTI